MFKRLIDKIRPTCTEVHKADSALLIQQQEQLADAEFLIKSFLHSQYIIERAEKWLEKYEGSTND